MGILAWIIIGGLAGWMASMVMKTEASMGIFANILVGIVGAFVGGFLFSIFGGVGLTGFNLYSLMIATLGSVVLLWVVGLARS